MPFTTFGLSKALLRAISDKGYSSPYPIQAKAIPAIMTGRDVLAAAQTGTGKTAAFTLPLLQILSKRTSVKGKRPIRVLIMVPTRELAAQVEESVKTYGAHLTLRSTVVFGGVNIKPQISHLRGGIDILVATPGRLLDLQGQKAVDLSCVETLVLDEADRMLDMGFIHDIRKIMKLLPKRRQNLLFSATFSKDVRKLTDQLLFNPISVEVSARNTPAETVEHLVYKVDKDGKPLLLKLLIENGKWERVLVFTRTKHGANRLSEKLVRFNITASAIHGNKSQNVRTKTLADFKAGRIRVLVATDIAARGLDIKQLPHVVNYELPNIPEDYIHRIGRTGRAGAKGHAVSLVCGEELKHLREIEKLLTQRLPVGIAPGFQGQVATNTKQNNFPSKSASSRSHTQQTDSSKVPAKAGQDNRNQRPRRPEWKPRKKNPANAAPKKGGKQSKDRGNK